MNKPYRSKDSRSGKPTRNSEQRKNSRNHKNSALPRDRRNEKNRELKEEPRRTEPEIPQEIYREELDKQLLHELSSLASDNAEQTARH